jgi:hypothetical protein
MGNKAEVVRIGERAPWREAAVVTPRFHLPCAAARRRKSTLARRFRVTLHGSTLKKGLPVSCEVCLPGHLGAGIMCGDGELGDDADDTASVPVFCNRGHAVVASEEPIRCPKPS